MNTLHSSLEFSHDILKETVTHGDNVIDATVGNGNDTLFLAQLVGQTGHVFGFDIQKQAIEATKSKIESSFGVENQVTLFNQSNAEIDNLIPLDTEISSAIFNLGYLPGGDKSIITTKSATIPAIQACLSRLTPHGVVVIVVYYGHPGGEEEKEAVLSFCRQLDQKKFNVLQYGYINQQHNPPILLGIEKR
ncbi:class I SAM-dependent methyltransferase [Lentilactobacillus sp. Marseille-Q4993]|uniref:class I SAM-dependent methyltransferase n=1 Tax=Lentilactobacillus sp. Marseille-Q4993 TaxID=3039492 RepID=UPI0024BCD7D4|nr:class I SAM-dependent methyltransferase [Lentilactobacillus sp. Marseille-Q4993]